MSNDIGTEDQKNENVCEDDGKLDESFSEELMCTRALSSQSFNAKDAGMDKDLNLNVIKKKEDIGDIK